METFVFVNGHLIERFGQALPLEAGATIYLSDNTALLVESVEVTNGVQTVKAIPVQDK